MRTLRPILCIAIAVSLSLVFVDRAQAIKVLMHGREAGATFRDDPFILTHLQDRYGAANVTYMQGSAAAADGSSANGFDAVFISSTMASSNTRNKYEDTPVGVVCDEGALSNDNSIGNYMFSDGSGNQDATAQTTGRNKINILDPTHPLAAGLSGEVTVFNTTPTDTYWWQFARGGLAPGVNRIAESLLDVGVDTVSGDYNNNAAADGADYVMYRKNLGTMNSLPNVNELPTPISTAHYDLWRARYGNTSAANDGQQHAILAAEVGAALYGNGTTGSPATAPGRRVFFFMSDFGFFDLSTDGVKLFDAAIDWAAAHPGAANGNSTVPEPGCCTLALIAILGGLGGMRRRSLRMA